MAATEPTWGEGWTVGLRVWIERAGQSIIGPGRAELLLGIERWHSISAAARQLGISYRHAWLLVQRINKAAGEALVTAATGGARGGGARLTPLGQWAVGVYRPFHDQLHQHAAVLLPRLVHPEPARTLHVAAAVSLEEVLGQLLADFALRQPSLRVRAIFGASDELADHVLAGAPADLFLSADARPVERLQEAGLVTGPAILLAENHLAAVGPAEGIVPVRKASDLARPAVKRVVLADPSSPLGGYTQQYLEGLGLFAKILPRVMVVDNSRAVLAAVRAGQADVGVVYGSDALEARDCRLLFRAGRRAPAVHYLAAVLTAAQQGTQALADFLTTAVAKERFRRCGFAATSPSPRLRGEGQG
jgi:molybdate transport system substrate-binding protein